MESSKQKSRMVWLDSLRLLAGVSMVGLHASSDLNGQPFPDFELSERIGPVLFRTLVYTARTELFLIISLFLLAMSLDRRPRSYGDTIKEQARRLMVPFAFWVLFFAFYRLIKANALGYEDAIWSQLGDVKHWVSYFLLGSVQYHMHFLPTLFALVLFVPLYRYAVEHPILGLAVLVCLFAKREIDLWIWSGLHSWEYLPYLVRLTKVITYTGYGIVAASFYGLMKANISDQGRKVLLVSSIYLAVMFFAIKLVYANRVIIHANWQHNYNPAYWADFIMPILLFAICFGLAHKNWPAIISKWAPFSFGIYLVHPIFLDILELTFWPMQLSPSLFVAVKTILGIALASILTVLLSKIHVLAWTVGLGPIPFWRNAKLGRSQANGKRSKI